jgi:CheY-like chemotaxis protein
LPSIRILLAGDPATCAQIKQTFQQSGMQLLTVSSGVETHNVIGFEHPDIAIIDMALPDLNGDDVCREIKADPATSATQIVMLVEAEEAWYTRRAQDAGANEILYKPIDAGDVVLMAKKLAPKRPWRNIKLPVRLLRDGQKQQFAGELVSLSVSGAKIRMMQCEWEAGERIWVKVPVSKEAAFVGNAKITQVLNAGDHYNLNIAFQHFLQNGELLLRQLLRRPAPVS